MMPRLLLCTDLDRTLLPNGIEPESPGARERFRKLADHSEVALAYVTGRHQSLVSDAIGSYEIPIPEYVIGDVGTSIYSICEDDWRPWKCWSDKIASDWAGLTHRHLVDLLGDIGVLRLQEMEKQNACKLSFYAAADLDTESVLAEIRRRLERHRVRANLTWSVDETVPTGLLDVTPAGATKLSAIEFLVKAKHLTRKKTIFAGDSGNDLSVLTSPIPAVLVANATDDVRNMALQLAKKRGTSNSLYCAKGAFRGMNGNYSAGILEGVAHYFPETGSWWS